MRTMGASLLTIALEHHVSVPTAFRWTKDIPQVDAVGLDGKTRPTKYRERNMAKPRMILKVTKGEHVYSPEWGDHSPCAECMGSKGDHRFVRREVIFDLRPPAQRRRKPPTKKGEEVLWL